MQKTDAERQISNAITRAISMRNAIHIKETTLSVFSSKASLIFYTPDTEGMHA
jgi:hypothetical protein